MSQCNHAYSIFDVDFRTLVDVVDSHCIPRLGDVLAFNDCGSRGEVVEVRHNFNSIIDIEGHKVTHNPSIEVFVQFTRKCNNPDCSHGLEV